jgi:UDP-galactopyranose mutase
MSSGFDILVVGAGLAGAVTARRLCEGFGLRCLVVDRRDHVGGLCHDGTDPRGVLVPSYGPHWFRTDSTPVKDFLDRFTTWHEVAFRVVAWTRGRHWSFPINLATFEQYLGRPSTTAEMEAALARWRQPIDAPRNSEEYVLSRVGRPFFELFYEGYTRKQWGREARDLDPSACGRIPIRTDRDDRYLSQGFQGMPTEGYTRMFQRILDHPDIEVRLGTGLRDIRDAVPHRHLVWTGPVDEFFDHDEGPLPWRSLRWEHETVAAPLVLPTMQVNYPDEHDYTRIIEPKHATGQRLPVTTIIREYPLEAGPGREPFYAVPAPDAAALHRRYVDRIACTADTTFLGRFAEYRNLDMDQVVLRALDAAQRLGTTLRRTESITLRPAPIPTPRPLQRRRDPLEPPAAVEVEVVVARHAEPVAWVRNVPSSARITVYDKGGDLDPRLLPWARVERLENVGHEAHTYLHHLVERYDDLAEVTFFCQGHPFDHAWDLHDALRNVASGRERVDAFRWLGFVIDTDDPRGRRLFVPWSKNRDGRELPLDRFHETLFGTPAPQSIAFYLGGQFAVTAAQARTRPRDFYRQALELARTFPDAAHCFERLWGPVFGVQGVDPALLGGELRRYLRSVRQPRP